MQVSKQDVEQVARLARLEITEAEKEAFSRQLSAILAYVDKLNALDTTGVEPTATVLEQVNVWREDKARPSLPAVKALVNAPETEDGYLVVPKIIGER